MTMMKRILRALGKCIEGKAHSSDPKGCVGVSASLFNLPLKPQALL
jgi:hypothetical protein